MNHPEDAPDILVDAYEHRVIEMISRPEVGAQAQFQNKKKPKKYKYDPTLSPTLQWAGKEEHSDFEVPTLPLFVHERLSTKAIISTLTDHRRTETPEIGSLFGDPQHSLANQLKSYDHKDKWANRMILGDSLVIMNSLLEYESMAGKVQMIYMDPPYGVKYNSNFQPFVRKKEVNHGDDDSFSREPEMVQAYRDTWELGIHSYLTYLRDRFKIARDLLTESGSIFVQISDENVHHVREVLDEVFGAENFVSLISYVSTSGIPSKTLSRTGDYLIWYGKSVNNLKFNQIYLDKGTDPNDGNYKWIVLPDGTKRGLKNSELNGEVDIPVGSKLYQPTSLISQGETNTNQEFVFNNTVYNPPQGQHWKTTVKGLINLAKKERIHVAKNSIRFIRYSIDFPYKLMNNVWTDTATGNFTDEKTYVVQTGAKVIQRCILMTTDPGDLVLDPTCGSGTTAFVAEQWGRRWITCDVSRVPLALARQRILTGTFPWYELKDSKQGPSGGFVYSRKKNNKGEEVGGLVPHITLKSIANDEEPEMEILVDRPDENKKITRVAGPFVVEAVIPPSGMEEEESTSEYVENFTNHIDRMIEVLRKTSILHVGGGTKWEISKISKPAKARNIHAEGESGKNSLAFHFGPENGAITERMVNDAIKEANLKNFNELLFVGFAIQPNARLLIDEAKNMTLPCHYIQVTPDFLMGDLLKNMRSSQIFSVCGLPDVEVKRLPGGEYQVKLVGMDTYDPTTMEAQHWDGNDVPAWFLDHNYNGLAFHVNQAFFPRTSAWDKIAKALKTEYDESVWDHLAGNLSAPFILGEHKRIAVKVIDERGNELLVEREV
ncbi:site-specific DNA-methyltransferase [Leptospira levettii]|nr:site-specific DNA-methyltransferase [Leptospira levettii]